MGCDGGTIPKRHELVKTAKKPEQKDKDMDRTAKWSTCSINQQVLTKPIVTCEMGKLYSKESVLEFLLDRTISETASHIRNLKDVKELKLTPNPGYKKNTSQLADQYADNQISKYVCPIVGLEMNGKYKFVALWSCGCVFSERAMKEVESDTCHNCGANVSKEDIIVLNPENEDIGKMRINMEDRREKLKALKKQKKEKKTGEKRKSDTGESSSKLNGDFVIPKPIVNGNVSEKSKISKLPNGNYSNTINGDAKKAKPESKKKEKKKETFIDPKQSKVYKNLFTSSEPTRDKDKSAHWITYNPYHL